MRQGRVVSDHGTHYFRERVHWNGEVLPGRRQKVQRYLCVGGPFAGAYRSSEELVEEKQHGVYFSFNNSGNSKHSMVFIHKDMLP